MSSIPASAEPRSDAAAAAAASASASPSAASPVLPPLLSVLTFNVLCPAYKRCTTAATPEHAPTRYRESINEPEWRTRVQAIVRALAEAHVDIMVLQEWWGAEPRFQRLVMDAAALSEYAFIVHGRTGGKDDGVAVLMRRRWIQAASERAPDSGAKGGYEMSLSALARHDISLAGLGNRVALVLQMQLLVTPVADVTAAAAAAVPASSASPGADGSAPVSNGARSHRSWEWRQHMQAHLASSSSAAAAASSSSAASVAAAVSSSSSLMAAPAALLPSPCVLHFLLVVTHLTFPHGVFDAAQRQLEIAHLLKRLDDIRYAAPGKSPGVNLGIMNGGSTSSGSNGALSSSPAVAPVPLQPLPPLCTLPVLLTGDFNTSKACTSDAVYQKIFSRGFRSSFAECSVPTKGQEAGCTHRNHRGESCPVDFIFLKDASPTPEQKKKLLQAPSATSPSAAADASQSLNFPSLRPCFSTLLPADLSGDVWPSAEDFSLSDHRPVLTVFELHNLTPVASVSRDGASGASTGSSSEITSGSSAVKAVSSAL